MKIYATGVGACIVAALLVSTVDATPQRVVTTAVASPNDSDLDDLLTRLVVTTEEYEKTFRNLTVEETRILEVYDSSGKVDKHREIRSDLLVYRAARADNSVTEFRDVQSVDGKVIEKRGERALKLLTDASKQQSLGKELQAINNETRKYEFGFHVQGFTIRQAGKWLKPPQEDFSVELVGRDEIAGHEVIVVDYRQIGLQPATPPPGARGQQLPKEFENAPFLVRGRLWVDVRTAQLWREVWEEGAYHPVTKDFLTMFHKDASYRSSDLGILVPERIVFDALAHFSHPKNGQPVFTLSARTTFTYGAFKRFSVTTDERMKTP